MFPLIPSFLSAAGSLLGGITSKIAGDHQAKLLRMRADQQNLEASMNAQSGMQDAARQEAAGFNSAANDGGFTGSAVNVLNDFSGTSLFNERAAIYRGQTEAFNSLNEAAAAKSNGNNALLGSVLNAGSSVLGAYGKYRDLKQAAGMAKAY